MNLKKSNKINYLILFKRSIAVISILLISLSSASLVFNSNASKLEEGVYKNPEAILNVSFNDDTYMDNIIDNVLPRIAQSSNKYGVSLISGLSKIGTTDELVTVSGEYSRSNIKREYKKEVGTLLSKIQSLKEIGTKNIVIKNEKNEEIHISEQQRNELNYELKKFSKEDVSKARWGYLWGDSKILSINIVGYKDIVTNIHELIKKTGHVKNSEIIDLKNQNYFQEEIKKKVYTDKILKSQKSEIYKKSNSELNDIVIEEVVNSTLTNEQIESIKKLNFLTEANMRKIDEIIKTDLATNQKNYSQEDFDKLPFNVEEKNEIKNMINQYNSSPSYLKNNFQGITKELSIQTSFTITEQANSFVDITVNGIVSKAALPAWLASVGAAANYLMFAMRYYSWVVFTTCAKNVGKCFKLVLDAITYGYTAYQIKGEFNKM